MVEQASLQARVRIISIFLICVGVFGVSFKIFQIRQTESSWDFIEGLVLATLGILALRLKISRKEVKIVLVLGLTELIEYILASKSSNNSQKKVIYGILGMALMLKCQIPIFPSNWMKIVLCLKFLYTWLFKNMIFGDVQIKLNSFQSVSVFYIIIVVIGVLQDQNLTSNSKKQQETQALINSIIFSLTDGILVLSMQHQVLFSNPVLPQLIGLGRKELMTYLSILAFEPKRKLVTNRENSNFLIDDLKLCKDLLIGEHLYLGSMRIYQNLVDIQAKKVSWINKTEGIIVIFRDTTYLANLQRLQTQNNCKLELLRFASHQLKTPTIGILGFLQSTMIEHQKELPVKAVEKIKVVEASAYLLYYTINDIIDYSKIITDQLVLEKHYFSICKWLEHINMMFVQQAKEAKISLNIRIDPKLPEYIYSDQLKLTQILVILLSNSLKYTFSGRIQVIALLNHEFKLKIIVADTGVGIPQIRLQKIKRVLKRNKIKGTIKIGLQIANRLSLELGTKKLNIASVPNKGTEITSEFYIFQYPIYESQEVVCQSMTSQEMSQKVCLPYIPQFGDFVKSNSILVVDDNEFNRITCINFLMRMGISCVEARNGIEAVQRVQSLDQNNIQIPLIIMDIDMPLMDGWKATKTIVELYEMKKIQRLPKIIGYSAFSSYEDINKCYDCGMVSYLSKPAQYLVLKSLMKNFVSVKEIQQKVLNEISA